MRPCGSGGVRGYDIDLPLSAKTVRADPSYLVGDALCSLQVSVMDLSRMCRERWEGISKESQSRWQHATGSNLTPAQAHSGVAPVCQAYCMNPWAAVAPLQPSEAHGPGGLLSVGITPCPPRGEKVCFQVDLMTRWRCPRQQPRRQPVLQPLSSA
jgi:hypothetical protein